MATPQQQEQQKQVMMTLKLLIDDETNRVLFAEAGKDVINFLFSLLTFPLGSIVNLILTNTNHLHQLKTVGCAAIANLHKSVQMLDESHMQPNINKTTALLNPTNNYSARLVSNNFTLLLAGNRPPPSDHQKKYYRCSNANYSISTSGIPSYGFAAFATANYSSSSLPPFGCSSKYNCSIYVSEAKDTGCPSCNSTMSTEMQLVMNTTQPVKNSGSSGEGSVGFVKGVVTYSVMDDLTVMPMSTISSIMLLNKFNIKDVGSLKERTVNLGFEEGLELLNASLHSKTVLTDVFLQGKKTCKTEEKVVD